MLHGILYERHLSHLSLRNSLLRDLRILVYTIYRIPRKIKFDVT